MVSGFIGSDRTVRSLELEIVACREVEMPQVFCVVFSYLFL